MVRAGAKLPNFRERLLRPEALDAPGACTSRRCSRTSHCTSRRAMRPCRPRLPGRARSTSSAGAWGWRRHPARACAAGSPGTRSAGAEGPCAGIARRRCRAFPRLRVPRVPCSRCGTDGSSTQCGRRLGFRASRCTGVARSVHPVPGAGGMGGASDLCMPGVLCACRAAAPAGRAHCSCRNRARAWAARGMPPGPQACTAVPWPPAATAPGGAASGALPSLPLACE